jgi:ribosomal subunit interface protein
MPELQVRTGSVPLTGELQELVDKRLAHLEKLHDRINLVRLSVTTESEHHVKGAPYDVMLEADIPGAVLVANKKRDEHLRTALTDAFDALERQLHTHLEKHRNH